MLFRIITAICGVAIIISAINTKNDKTGKYTTTLKEKYTDASIAVYIKSIVVAECFFGSGFIVQAILGSDIGFYIGTFICLLGIIIMFVAMKKLVKKNIPYRNKDKS